MQLTFNCEAPRFLRRPDELARDHKLLVSSQPTVDIRKFGTPT
jgi:hypothetical protein